MADILIHGISIPRERDHLTITINADGTVHPLVDMYCPIIAHAIELPEHLDLISLKDAKTVIDRFLGYLDEEMIYRIKYKLNQDCTVIVPSNKEDAE